MRLARMAANSTTLRLVERVLTTRVMGWPLGLASEHPGLGRYCCLAKSQKNCPITHPAWASNPLVRAEADVRIVGDGRKVNWNTGYSALRKMVLAWRRCADRAPKPCRCDQAGNNICLIALPAARSSRAVLISSSGRTPDSSRSTGNRPARHSAI